MCAIFTDVMGSTVLSRVTELVLFGGALVEAGADTPAAQIAALVEAELILATFEILAGEDLDRLGADIAAGSGRLLDTGGVVLDHVGDGSFHGGHARCRLAEIRAWRIAGIEGHAADGIALVLAADADLGGAGADRTLVGLRTAVLVAFLGDRRAALVDQILAFLLRDRGIARAGVLCGIAPAVPCHRQAVDDAGLGRLDADLRLQFTQGRGLPAVEADRQHDQHEPEGDEENAETTMAGCIHCVCDSRNAQPLSQLSVTTGVLVMLGRSKLMLTVVSRRTQYRPSRGSGKIL